MNSLFRVLLCILAVVSSPAMAQTNTYEVRIANHAVGTIEARQNVNGHEKSISIQTHIQVMLSKVNSIITTEYSHNILTQAKSSRVTGKNGDDKLTTTRKEGNAYTIVMNGERSVLGNTEIQHCVGDLYFSEPKHITRTFSETLGKFLPLKALGDGSYELQLPEGKKNIYKYDNGTLVQVEVDHTFGKAIIVKSS
ncbi:MAG: hypothetical protein JO154_16920 [Chitinophaga sp.]|uniref:DUF6134 family protein n=1 Tax=Chitinophaga sp. TaxID=1869181 RepID=UPI0025C5D736|nr:DUF6134 family protein [Chitinophaga sp.]MBV8254285.1 hypothetical protein [Chitinophaga sp.]